MPKSSQDPRTFIPLADGKPLMTAIPKKYLGMLSEKGTGYYDTQGNLAERLSTSERTIHRQTVNGWIKGTLHMSNRDVIHVSHVLNVSPLCVLDLCGPTETESPTAFNSRTALGNILLWLKDWQATGNKPSAIRVKTASEMIDTIKGVKGDYRDLQKLAIDTTAYYAGLCDIGKMSGFISRIVEAGRTCCMGKTNQAQ